MPDARLYLIIVADADWYPRPWMCDFAAVQIVHRDGSMPGLSQFDALRFEVCERFGLEYCWYVDADVDILKPFRDEDGKAVVFSVCANPAADEIPHRTHNNGIMHLTRHLPGRELARDIIEICGQDDRRNVGLDAFNTLLRRVPELWSELPAEYGRIWWQGPDTTARAVHWCNEEGHRRRFTTEPRRITILGGGISAVERHHDILKYCTGEVRVMNDGYLGWGHIKDRIGRIYEMHGWDYLRNEFKPREPSGETVDHFDALRNLGCEVWTGGVLPLIPGDRQHVVPFEDMARQFKTRFFLGSPSLMLAHALYEHVRGVAPLAEIRTWGIDTLDSQHQQQRVSWAWWCSKAASLGVALTGSALNWQGMKDNDGGLEWLHEMLKAKVNLPA